jgi:beta-phosphoglucomutase-like phosphatase (HAD superfamily)
VTANLPSQLRLVILDCDGVLFDSYAANVLFYNSILARMGLAPLDERGRELAHRLATPQLFAGLFRDDDRLLARALEVARSTDYGPSLELMAPAAGLVDILQWLSGRYSTALATNRGRTIPQMLARFELAPYFGLVVGIEDVARPKPAPDMLLRCLEHFDMAPSQAVYVGDSPTDLEAACAAGIAFVAIGSAVEATPRLGSLGELRALLEPADSRRQT